MDDPSQRRIARETVLGNDINRKCIFMCEMSCENSLTRNSQFDGRHPSQHYLVIGNEYREDLKHVLLLSTNINLI